MDGVHGRFLEKDANRFALHKRNVVKPGIGTTTVYPYTSFRVSSDVYIIIRWHYAPRGRCERKARDFSGFCWRAELPVHRQVVRTSSSSSKSIAEPRRTDGWRSIGAVCYILGQSVAKLSDRNIIS